MVTIAIIGLGNRGRMYGSHFMKNKDARVVALCEKNKEFLCEFQKKWNVPAKNCLENDSDFFAAGKLADVLVVATQDRDHYGHAMSALALGYELLLEKPVSPFLEQTKEIYSLAKQKNLRVVVCHVLRYAKFYDRIKQVIDSGAIGNVKHVNHTENVGYWHFSHSYVRGNWRRQDQTAPSILAKCCHDLDMIYYLTGKHCLAVSSSGSLDYFTKKNKPQGAPKYCEEGCPSAKDCPYEARKIYYAITKHTLPYMIVNAKLITQNPHPTIKMLKESLKTSPYGRCVFDCDNDVMEKQVVNMVLEDNVTATMNMIAFSKRCYRKIHIYGDKGEIFGNDIDGCFTLNVFGGKSKKIRVARRVISLHGSCDKIMANEFVDLMNGKPCAKRITFLSDTLESHKVAWASELARISQKTEKIDD